MKTTENTYVLEKTWKIESKDFKFDLNKFDYALIRPCNIPYKTYRDFSLGKKTRCKQIVHEGCVAYWYADDRLPALGSSFKTFEEFLVNANINKQAVPEFENWQFDFNWKTYTVRIIDLKTGEVLYDHIDKWLSENKRRGLI